MVAGMTTFLRDLMTDFDGQKARPTGSRGVEEGRRSCLRSPGESESEAGSFYRQLPFSRAFSRQNLLKKRWQEVFADGAPSSNRGGEGGRATTFPSAI